MKVYRAVQPVRPYLKTMKMNQSFPRLALAGFLAVVLSGLSFGQGTAKGKAAVDTTVWEKDPSVAFAKAKKEGKRVFIDFYTTWCGPCKSMDRQVFPRMKRYAEWNKLIHLKIDAENPNMSGLVKRFKVEAYPTMIVASPDRKQLLRIEGSLPDTELREKLTNLNPRPNKVPKIKRPGG